MTNLLQRILPTVQKPARYTGGEYNQVVKPLEQVDVRIAFCFPDTYELGMSNLGMRILYGVMNEMEGVWCQRSLPPGATWKPPWKPTASLSGLWRARTQSGTLT